jgi:hypothetical protein
MHSDALLAAAAIDERDGHLPIAKARRTRAAAVAAKASSDPAVAALQVRALLALGRDDDAVPLARKLIAGGYREGELIALTARLTSLHSPPPSPSP